MNRKFHFYTLIVGLLCFIVFMTVSCGAHYLTTGLFPDAQPTAVYAILGAVGALAVLLRQYRFALVFYAGAILGWTTGRFIGGLEGEFAPTAALIATWFLIAVFALLGLAAEIRHWKRVRRKKLEQREKQRQEDEEKQTALRLAQEEKAKAAKAPDPKDQSCAIR